MPDSTWSTAVGEVSHGVINVRGYPLTEIIESLTFAETVFLTIRGELPTPGQARVMDAVLCSIVEHGFYAPTSIAANVIASAAPETIMPAVAGALLTVGSVTVSPQHSGELIEWGLSLIDSGKDLSHTADTIASELTASGRRMPGVGHPLHPEGDPRAAALRRIVEDNGVRSVRSDIFEAVRQAFVQRIHRPLPVNVDGAMGCALSELGFTPKEMPGIAAMSYMPGIIAHAVEEVSRAIRLRVVDGEYLGQSTRHLPTPNGTHA